MPQRFREPQVSTEMPKTGAEYFEEARAAGEFVDEDTQMQTDSAPTPVERTKARTRGHTEHPGYRPPGAGRPRKKAQNQRRLRPASEGNSPVVTNPRAQVQLSQISEQMPLIEGRNNGQANQDIVPPSDVQTKTRRTYSRVIPENGAEPVPLTEEEITHLEKLEDDLEQVLLEQAQWKIHMAGLDRRIQGGIGSLRVDQKEECAENLKLQTRRKGTRGTNTDYLIFGDMNANIAMELARGVFNRMEELEEEANLG